MIVNASSILQHVIQIKNRIMKHVNVSVKIIVPVKKDCSWNSSKYICENDEYIERIAVDSKNV